jgi:hypothetical protein
MKNKLLLLAAVLASVFFSCDRKSRAKTEKSISNELPVMQITLLNGTIVDAKKLSLPAVLILFQPDCDHCQREAGEIREHLTEFKDYTLYFVSSAATDNVQKFAYEYKLTENERVLFGVTTVSNILDNFGPIQAPSIYIYSATGKRVQEFNGEVAIEVILKYL